MTREVLQQALALAEDARRYGESNLARKAIEAIDAIKEALAHPITQAVPQIPQEHSSDGMEAVYEAIVHWDEGGGKRSRRELARRIVALQEYDRGFREPVAKVVSSGEYDFPMLQWLSANHSLDTKVGSLLYATPPQHEWVGLTEEEREECVGEYYRGSIAAAIEAKLKEKNA